MKIVYVFTMISLTWAPVAFAQDANSITSATVLQGCKSDELSLLSDCDNLSQIQRSVRAVSNISAIAKTEKEMRTKALLYIVAYRSSIRPNQSLNFNFLSDAKLMIEELQKPGYDVRLLSELASILDFVLPTLTLDSDFDQSLMEYLKTVKEWPRD